MLRLLAVAAMARALPRNDGKSDEKLSHEAQTYYDPAAQTFALYTLLGVPTNATLTEIDRAFVKHKNDLERNRKNKKNVQIYGLIYKSLDEDEDGLLSAEESESLVEALGLRFDEEDDHVQESVAKFRRRTCTDKDAVFSSKEHLMIVATYASLRTARVTLGDAEMRTKYDEQERIKAREYAEDVDDDNTYLGAAKRKVFGVIYYGIYGGIVVWTIVAVIACLAYVACKALASIPNAPPLFGRCADRCGSVLIWINPGWSTVCTLAFCAPSTVLAAMLSAFAVFLFLFSLLAKTPVVLQRGLCALIIAALLAWLVPAVKNVLTRPREHVRRLVQGLRGLGREAWGVGKVLVPGAALGLVYSMFEVELETHLLTALAGGVVVIMAVKPLRSRAFRYLGQALADTGVTQPPSEAPRILEALQRLATLPVELYVPINVLDDAQVKAKLERAGFSRRDGAATPSRAELEAAYDDAYGACTVCFAQFEAGDECVRLLCGHVFHRDCVVQWVNTRTESGRVPTCPQCTCDMCHEVHAVLAHQSIDARALHSQLPQYDRTKALEAFQQRRSQILVCTDVASRGLDLPAIDLVINFDVPRDPDDYIHRVGRCARNGHHGLAVSLITQSDLAYLAAIEGCLGSRLAKCARFSEKSLPLQDVARAVESVGSLKQRD